MEARLQTCVGLGRAAWPGVTVDAITFATHLGRHCAAASDLDKLAIEDLYLAAACAARDDAALRALDAKLAPDLERALSRLRLGPDELDDIRLVVMTRLVVDTPPKVALYSGRSSLEHWLAAVIAREALTRRRTAARRRGLLEAAADNLAPADPELSFIKSHYREHFKSAFADAVAGLPPGDRTVLRHRFVDGLTLDQLAAALGVHRATSARRLAAIREALLSATRGGLCDRLGVEGPEVDSVVRLIASNFEVSVRRMLAE